MRMVAYMQCDWSIARHDLFLPCKYASKDSCRNLLNLKTMKPIVKVYRPSVDRTADTSGCRNACRYSRLEV